MPFVADNPEAFIGKTLGDGHCVALIRAATDAPETARWRRGAKVAGNGASVEPGTVIATFDSASGRYTSRTDGTAHAALYEHEAEAGIVVIDQWISRPTQARTIMFRGGSGKPINDADAYYVVEAVT
jgi:hypothetical protein